MAVEGLGAYQRSILAARQRSLRRSASTVESMMTMLEDAAGQIRAILDITPKNAMRPVTARLMQGKLADIEAQLVTLGNDYNFLVNGAARETIDDVVQAHRAATPRLAEANGRSISASFARTPVAALANYAGRIDVDGLKISGEIWAQSQMQTIERVVGSAMARGESAGKLARRLEAFLNPDQRGGAKRVIHAGDTPVSHKAARLAITEINNTYWETTAMSAQESAVVSAQMWQLSGRHPKTDECDLFAWSDSYDLGAGVYPSGRVPAKPHPLCLCYLIDVIREPSQWNRPKPEPGSPTVTRIDRRALADAPKAVRDKLPETFSPAELEAAVRGMPKAERGHLTERYVQRMSRSLSTGTGAPVVPVVGRAVEVAVPRAQAVGVRVPPAPAQPRPPAPVPVSPVAKAPTQPPRSVPTPPVVKAAPVARQAVAGHPVMDDAYWERLGVSGAERRQYEEAIAGWKADGFHPIRVYQEGGAKAMQLRAPGYDVAQARDTGRQLEAFAAKAPTYTGGPIWRGASYTDAQNRALAPGAEFQTKSLASTSTDRAAAMVHALKGSRPVLLRIEGNRSGVSIRNDASQWWPDSDFEAEVMVPSKTKYRVVSRGPIVEGGRTLDEIVLEEIE